jgi:hypothetical protein
VIGSVDQFVVTAASYARNRVNSETVARLRGGAAAIRFEWLKISKSWPRAMATSVIPHASATRTGSAVGTDTATRIEAPTTAAFCTH